MICDGCGEYYTDTIKTDGGTFCTECYGVYLLLDADRRNRMTEAERRNERLEQTT